MPTPLEFRERYFNIAVDIAADDKIRMFCHTERMNVRLKNYFMMNWHVGSSQMTHFTAVSAGSNKDIWFRLHKEDIRSAAMGKGAPDDYGLALEWAVYSNRITNCSQTAIQAYFDDNMGLDCSGFATNYLIANGKKPNSFLTKQNTSAASYFSPANAVNNVTDIRQGDLLVYMHENTAMQGRFGTGPVMVVESASAACSMEYPFGSLQVVESTSNKNAKPKLSSSTYAIEKIILKSGPVPCMILLTKRLGSSGFRVSVMRP